MNPELLREILKYILAKFLVNTKLKLLQTDNPLASAKLRQEFDHIKGLIEEINATEKPDTGSVN